MNKLILNSIYNVSNRNKSISSAPPTTATLPKLDRVEAGKVWMPASTLALIRPKEPETKTKEVVLDEVKVSTPNVIIFLFLIGFCYSVLISFI